MKTDPFHTSKDGNVYAYIQKPSGELWKVKVIGKIEDGLFMVNRDDWDNPRMIQSSDLFPHLYSFQFQS